MAENTEGGLLFGIRLDNSELAKDVELSNKLFASIGQRAEDVNKVVEQFLANAQDKVSKTRLEVSPQPIHQGVQSMRRDIDSIPPHVGEAMSQVQELFEQLNGNIQNLGQKAKGLVAGYFSFEGIKGFFDRVTATRSEFASVQASFETLLGSKSKADDLFGQVKQYGATTPMNLKDLASATNTMLSFGLESEKVMDYLKALGDVSGGDAQKFQSLSLAFSQASASGKLMGQDLMQMINAGFNPLEQMAKTTGKSIAELKDEMSAGKISAEMLQQAFMDATKEGGKYHGMLNAQSKTLKGAMSNLQDNIDSIYNEIGEATEEYIIDAINGLGELAQNWKEIGTIVLEIAAVYGTWKAASMFETAVENVMTQKRAEESLVEAFRQHGDQLKSLMDEEDAYAMKMTGLEEGSAEYMQSLQDMWKGQAEESGKALEQITLQEDALKAMKEKIEESIGALEDETASWEDDVDVKTRDAVQTEIQTRQEKLNTVQEQLNTVQKQKQAIAQKAATASKKADTLATMQNTAAIKSQSAAMVMLHKVQTMVVGGLKKLGNAIKTALASNPIGAAIAAFTILVELIMEAANSMTFLEQAEASRAEADASAIKLATERKNKLYEQFKELEKLKEGSDEYKSALNDLVKEYPKLNDLVNEGADKNKILADGYELLKDNIMDLVTAEAYEQQVKKNQGTLDEDSEKIAKEFAETLKDLEYSTEEAQYLSKEFRKALMDGLAPSEMSEELQKVFQKAGEETTKLWRANYTDADNWWEFTKGIFKERFGGDSGFNDYGSKIEAMAAKHAKLTKALSGTNKEMKDFADNVRDANDAAKDAVEEQLSPVLKGLQDRQKTLKATMDGYTEDDLKNTELLKKNQKEYAELERQIKAYNKKAYGDVKEAQKKAEDERKKQLQRYKSFATEYVKIEAERLKKLDELNRQAEVSNANKAIIDMQKEDANQKANDEQAQLSAKYFDVDAKAYENIKKAFEEAFNTPAEEAKKKILEVENMLARIDAGKVNVSKEDLAKLQAQQAGYSQVIEFSYKRDDFSAQEKVFEEFYNKVFAIAEDKEAKLQQVNQRMADGLISEDAGNQALASLSKTADAEMRILAQTYGMSVEQLLDGVMAKTEQATTLVIGELESNMANVKTQIDYLQGQLANGLDVSAKLNEMQALYDQMLADVRGKTDEVLGILIERQSEYLTKIKDLEARLAAGEDVAQELALYKTSLANVDKEIDKAKDKQAELATSSEEVSEATRRMRAIMADQAKWKKIRGYYDTIGNGMTQILDATDAVSDETKEVINGLMDLGGSLFDIVDQLQQNAISMCQATEAAGEGAAEAVSTAEKGSVILMVIQAAIKAVMMIIKIWKKHGKTAQAEKQIKALQTQVDNLDESYQRLDKAIQKAYGNSAKSLMNEQDALLQQKKALLQQQITEEKSKKGKKQDADQIRQWEKEIRDIDEMIANRPEDWATALVGKDYNGVLEDFSGAVMAAMDDANTSVEDAVKNISKSLKKSAVLIQLNDKLKKSGLTDAYGKALADAMVDGVIDETERATLEGLESSIADISEDYLSQFDDLWDKAEAERQAVSGGVTNMTQDTAEVMNGRLTQIQSHTFALNEHCKQLVAFSSEQLAMLQSINGNTAEMVAQARDIVGYMADFSLRGVKMK